MIIVLLEEYEKASNNKDIFFFFIRHSFWSIYQDNHREDFEASVGQNKENTTDRETEKFDGSISSRTFRLSILDV